MKTYLPLPCGYRALGDANEHNNDDDAGYIPNQYSLTLFNQRSKSIPRINYNE